MSVSLSSFYSSFCCCFEIFFKHLPDSCWLFVNCWHVGASRLLVGHEGQGEPMGGCGLWSLTRSGSICRPSYEMCSPGWARRWALQLVFWVLRRGSGGRVCCAAGGLAPARCAPVCSLCVTIPVSGKLSGEEAPSTHIPDPSDCWALQRFCTINWLISELVPCFTHLTGIW